MSVNTRVSIKAKKNTISTTTTTYA